MPAEKSGFASRREFKAAWAKGLLEAKEKCVSEKIESERQAARFRSSKSGFRELHELSNRQASLFFSSLTAGRLFVFLKIQMYFLANKAIQPHFCLAANLLLFRRQTRKLALQNPFIQS